MLRLACHVCDAMVREEGDGPLCDDCLTVVARVHEIKSKPTGRKHLTTCNVCEGKGYNLNSLSPDGNVLPWPVAQVCWACGGVGKG